MAMTRRETTPAPAGLEWDATARELEGTPETAEVSAPGHVPDVLLITDDTETARLSEALRREGIPCRVARSHYDARAQIQAGRHVVVVDCDMPQDTLVGVYQLLNSAEPMPVLMLSTASNPALLMSFIGYGRVGSILDSEMPGYREYIWKPIEPSDFALRVKAALLRLGHGSPAAPAVPEETAVRPSVGLGRSSRGTMVTMFSAKGGVGKSTIAVNLAVGLARVHGFKVLVVDADLWFGDVGALLDVASRRGIFDLCSEEEPDIGSLREVVVTHDSGVSVLLRPSDMSAAEKLNAHSIVKLLAASRRMFDYVVVDTHTSLDELNLAILDETDQILLVTTPDISAAANTSRFLKIAGTLGYMQKISLVVNRANCGIDLGELQATLRMKISATVASAGQVMIDSVNKGTPLLFLDRYQDHPAAHDLAKAAAFVAGGPRLAEGTSVAERPRLLRLAFGSK